MLVFRYTIWYFQQSIVVPFLTMMLMLLNYSLFFNIFHDKLLIVFFIIGNVYNENHYPFES